MSVEGHRVVSHEAWVEERKALLAKEKELTRLRDELQRAAARPPVGAGDEEVRVRWAARSRDPPAALRGALAARRLPRDVRCEDRDAEDAVHQGRSVLHVLLLRWTISSASSFTSRIET